MKEIWADIKGYEGLYQVSNYGRVKSLGNGKTHKAERILKSYITRWGYLRVNLYKNGVGKKYHIHQLVAQAFIPNPNNLYEVNHIDENKLNNNVENLEWCTKSYNINYGIRNKKCSVKMVNNIKRSKCVAQYTLDNKLVKVYPSIMEAQRQTGIDNGNIGKCCRGTYSHKTLGGFIWKYADQD